VGRIIYCRQPKYPKPPIPGSRKDTYNEIVKKEHYGVEVWENVITDKVRKTKCLCFNCRKLGKCDIANHLYQFCKKNNIALMMTRCKEFDFEGECN
jgi:hypothetical protein